MTDYIDDFISASARPAHSMQNRNEMQNSDRHTSRFDDVMLKDLPVAMAYVPMQTLGKVYEPDGALESGTLFEALDKPFLGRRGINL